MEEENDQDIIYDVARVVGKTRKPRGPTRDRNIRMEQWTELYNQKSRYWMTFYAPTYPKWLQKLIHQLIHQRRHLTQHPCSAEHFLVP